MKIREHLQWQDVQPGKQVEIGHLAGFEPAGRSHHRHPRVTPSDLLASPTIVELAEGFEAPFGADLPLRVHWVATRESQRDTVTAAHARNERKQQFTPSQMEVALQTLAHKGLRSRASSSPREVAP